MAGVRSNQAWWAIQKQTTPGTAAAGTAASVHKIPFSGGSIGPLRETDRLAETDSSIDQGDPFVTTSGVEGSPEAYLRDSFLPLLLHGVLNGAITTLPGPPIQHAVDASTNDLPLFTIWKNVGGAHAAAIAEQYHDCRIGSLTISGEAGGALTIAAGIQGRVPTKPAVPAGVSGKTLANDTVYLFSHATDYAASPDTSLITFGGAATFKIRSFELTIENNLSRQQTNSVYPLDTAPGIREISLGFDLIFDDKTHYDNFHYAGGTEVSPDVYQISTPTTFTFRRGTNNEVTLTLPKIALEEFPVEPDPGGDPIVVPVRAVAMRHATPVQTVTKNNIAATAYASA